MAHIASPQQRLLTDDEAKLWQCKTFEQPNPNLIVENPPTARLLHNQSVWLDAQKLVKKGAQYDLDRYLRCPTKRLGRYQGEIKELSSQVEDHWGMLRKLLSGDDFNTLFAAFSAMNSGERTKLLKSVLQNMPEQHQPEMEAFLRNDDAGGYKLSGAFANTPQEKIRWSYMVPAINVEDLILDSTTGTVLTDFIKVRGSEPPSKFRFKDLGGAHLAIGNNAIRKADINGHFFDVGVVFNE